MVVMLNSSVILFSSSSITRDVTGSKPEFGSSQNKYLISIDGETFETCNYEKHNNVENLKKDNLVDIPHLNELGFAIFFPEIS